MSFQAGVGGSYLAPLADTKSRLLVSARTNLQHLLTSSLTLCLTRSSRCRPSCWKGSEQTYNGRRASDDRNPASDDYRADRVARAQQPGHAAERLGAARSGH